MKLKKLVQYMDDYLESHKFASDISQNGLQVEGDSEVTKIIGAVDACFDTIKKTHKAKGQLLLTHHGLFWGTSLLITGVHKKRIAYLLEKGISLYASHLPLDAHREVGNNVELAKLIGAEVTGDFGIYRGLAIGVAAKLPEAQDREHIAQKALKCLKAEGRFLDFGPKKVRRVAIITGSVGRFLERAIVERFDMLITGEGGHISYHESKEHKINLLYAGHYATETLGVKALGKHLQEKFSLEFEFVEVPTGF